MRYLNARTPIALAVISVLLVLAPASQAANPGEVEFTSGDSTVYLANASTTISWAAYGELTGATCQLSKLSPSASTPFPTTSCAAAVANAPTVSASLGSTSYSWPLAPMASGDGVYRVTYAPTFALFPTLIATRDFVVDTVSPVVTASTPNGVTTDNTPQVGYAMQDVNPDRVECAVDPVDPLDPAQYAVCPPSPFSLPALAEGEHKFYVVGYDLAGRLTAVVKVFTVDATGPVITIAGLTEGEIVTTAWPPLSVGASDPGTGVMGMTCAYDGAAAASCSDANFLNAPLPDGAHSLHIVATDVAGNVSSATIRFTVDTTGGLKQGLVAPKNAKFAVKRGKLKGTKYATILTASFAMPAGSTATSCSGSATFSAVVKKKQIGSASAKFKRSGAKCVATAKAKFSKKFKGKKLALTLAYKSGPIKAFTLRGSAKL